MESSSESKTLHSKYKILHSCRNFHFVDREKWNPKCFRQYLVPHQNQDNMTGFASSAMRSVKANRRLLKSRKFLRSNLYKIKGTVIGSKKSKRKYQSFFDKLAILILHKMGYKNVA